MEGDEKKAEQTLVDGHWPERGSSAFGTLQRADLIRLILQQTHSEE